MKFWALLVYMNRFSKLLWSNHIIYLLSESVGWVEGEVMHAEYQDNCSPETQLSIPLRSVGVGLRAEYSLR